MPQFSYQWKWDKEQGRTRVLIAGLSSNGKAVESFVLGEEDLPLKLLGAALRRNVNATGRKLIACEVTNTQDIAQAEALVEASRRGDGQLAAQYDSAVATWEASPPGLIEGTAVVAAGEDVQP